MAKMVRHTSEELKAMRDRGESKTDWERVKRDIATDAPIHYDPAVDPYDPNDDAAVETYWSQATIIRRGVRRELCKNSQLKNSWQSGSQPKWWNTSRPPEKAGRAG